MPRRILAAAAASLAVAAGPSSAQGETPWRWSTGDDATRPVVLREKPDATDARTFEVTLPAGADGKEAWQLVRLDALARFVAKPRGKAVLSMSLNDRAAAQVVYTADGSGTVHVASLGALGGESTDARGTHTLRFTNYAVDASARPGPATVTFALESLRGRLFESLTVEGTSGLERTTTSPEQLAISTPDRVTGQVGAPVEIPYHVIRRGDRPDLPLTVAVFPGPQVTVPDGDEGARTHHAVGRGVQGTLVVSSERVGEHQVRVLGQGGYNDVGRVVVVRITPASSGGSSPALPLGAAAAVIGLAGTWTLRRRHHA